VVGTSLMRAVSPHMVVILDLADPLEIISAAVGAAAVQMGNLAMERVPLIGMKGLGHQAMEIDL
jgi:hypothetical protein